MEVFTLTGTAAEDTGNANRIFCPSVQGLSAPRADLAFLMPRLDHHRVLTESVLQGGWAAVLASDPFGSEATTFRRLFDIGYRGLINWPSSILLDGAIRQSMSTIPASPEFEYDYLARAKAAGLKTMAFFRSLEQARAAQEAGLNQLVIHPGVLDVDTLEDGSLIQESLKRLLETIKSESNDLTILAYTSDWHERIIKLSELPVDGIVRLEVDQ